MGKYLTIFKNSLNSELTYRFNFFAMFFFEAVSLFVFIYLWLAIYRQGGTAGDYSFRAIITYYIASKFISLIVKSKDNGWIIGDIIREGRFSPYLIKPISFFWQNFYENVAASFLRAGIYSVIIIFCLLFFNFRIPDALTATLFLISLIIGACLNFLIFYMVGISTFYFGIVMGFNYIMASIAVLFSGSLIPLDLLPSTAMKASLFLPFRHIIFTPVSIALGRISAKEGLFYILYGLIWTAALFAASKILYKNGLKKYEGQGL